MYTYKLGGMLITDELYHDDLEAMTFGRKDQNELMHYGIKGQSWGKRRFQNEDGSLTMAGRNRYDVGDPMKGVSAFADTGGRGGSGVNYNRLPGGTGGSTRSATANQAPARLVGSNPRGRATTSATTTQKVANTTNAGRKAADNLFGRIGNWASNAAKDVGNFATNTYNDASKAVTNVANDVGNAVKNVAQDVSDWYTGDKAGREAQRYDNVVQNFERAGDANINAGEDIISRGLKYPESAHDLESGQSMRDKTVIEGLDRRNLGYDQHDIARQYGQKADEAQARYEAAPRQVINSAAENVGNAAKDAGNWLGNAFNDAKNWVGDRAQDVGKAATNAYNDVSKAAGDAVNWVGDRARDVGNLVSNQDEKRAAENAQNVADRILDDAIARSGEYVPDEKGGEDLYIRDYNDAKVVDAADKRAADAKQAYENHPLTKIQNAANDVKSLFSDGSKEREALAEARSKVDEYADDPEFMSYFYKDNPEEAKRFADEQVEARKQLKQAENNYMDFSNNPVNTVSRALNLPNNKGNWAFAVPGNEQYLQTMKTGFIPKTENIGDWFTGNNYKRTADTHNQYAKDYEDLADQAYAYGRESAETGRGPSQDWWNSEGDYIKNVYAKEDRDIADANMNMYNNAPRQKIVNAANQVGETVSGAAKDVANWGGQQVENGKKLFKKIFG